MSGRGRVTVGSRWRFAAALLLCFEAVALACGNSKGDEPGPSRGGNAGATGGGDAGSNTGGGGGSRGGTGGSGVSGSAGSGVSSGGSGGAGTGSGGIAGNPTGGTDDTGGEGGAGGNEACPPATEGTWSLNDDNLWMVVDGNCRITNFCSIAEGIHTTGSLMTSALLLDSVGGSPLAFAYTLEGDILTLLDAGPAPERVDLPLSRTQAPLPETCPAPSSTRTGAVGTRCDVAGDCAEGLECFSRFFEERRVCTTTCAGSCPDGAQCVAGVPDYNGQPTGSYCLRPCQMSIDCANFGSECDAPSSSSSRHCF